MILRWLAIFSRAAVSIRGLLGEQGLQRLARLLADGVAILQEPDLVDLGQRVGHGVGQLVELVAG